MSVISFSGRWVAASVRKNPRREFLEDPVKFLERLRAANKQAVIQVFDARSVVSVKQIHAMAVATHLAFKAGTNISKKFEIELLLRLAADTQIERALKRLGVSSKTKEVGCCVITDDKPLALKVSRDLLTLVGGDEMREDELREERRMRAAMKFYGITEKEVESVQSRTRAEAVLILILERIATLDLKR